MNCKERKIFFRLPFAQKDAKCAKTHKKQHYFNTILYAEGSRLNL